MIGALKQLEPPPPSITSAAATTAAPGTELHTAISQTAGVPAAKEQQQDNEAQGYSATAAAVAAAHSVQSILGYVQGVVSSSVSSISVPFTAGSSFSTNSGDTTVTDGLKGNQ